MKLLCMFALLYGSAMAADLTLQISNETAPPGGWVQIKVVTTTPQLIGFGRLVLKLDPAVFGTTQAVATFGAAGDAFGSAGVTGQQVDAQFTSLSGRIGQLPGVPVLAVTVPVLSTVAPGTISAITADANQSKWTDATGNVYALTVAPGSVTVGGILSVENLSPGGGLLPAGTVVKINGTGFTSSTVVSLAGVSIAQTQFVSPQEIDLTLQAPAELTGKKLVLLDADGEQVQYFSAMPSAPNFPASSPIHYMLSLETFSCGGKGFNPVVGGGIVLQNQNLTPVTVFIQGFTVEGVTNNPAITIPAGGLYAYGSYTPSGFTGFAATASQPIRMLGPTSGDPINGILPISVWAVSIGNPMAVTLSASPAAASFTYQIGTAAPAPVLLNVQWPDGAYSFTPFTTTTDGPFIVTPAQGTTPGNISVGVIVAGRGAGTYTGSLTIIPTSPNGTALTVPLSLLVSAAPLISANPPQLMEFFTPVSYPPGQPVTIKIASNGNPAPFTVSPSTVPWMTLSASSGTTPASISATFNIAGVAFADYTTQITVAGPSNTLTIPISMNVSPDGPNKSQIGPQAPQFAAQTGGLAPPSQTFLAGIKPLTLSVATATGGPWLTAVSNDVNVVVSVNPAGLKAGIYTGTITLSSPTALTAQWPVTLVMYDTPPPLIVTPASLMFSGPADSLQPQTLNVRSGGVPLSLALNDTVTDPAARLSAYWISADGALTDSQGAQTPATLQVSVSAPSGIYQGSIGITGAGETVLVPVSLNILPPAGEPPYLGSIVSAASGLGGAISPGEIITVYGYSVGPLRAVGVVLDSTGSVATSLTNASVLFDGKPAPLIYAAGSQLNVMVPYEIAGQASTFISLSYGGVVSTAWAVPVAASAPGIFTLAGSGLGPGAVLNQDGSVNSAANPAARGSIVSIYATGEGQTSPAGVTGGVSSITKMPLLPVSASIGGVDTLVQYAGSAPGEIAGLLQVNAVVPQGSSTGAAVPVTLSVGGIVSQAGVTIAVK